jgi:hypothetical protein
MMTNDESRLDDLFRRYRDACPEVEPSAKFMPALWRKIESRQSFWSVFERLGGLITAASAVLCLLLLALTIAGPPSPHTLAATYADALMADHSVEKTYYAEAIRTNPQSDDQSAQPNR